MMMKKEIKKEIWVFGDLRSRHLLDLSFKVVSKASLLAKCTGDEVVLFLLTPGGNQWLTRADEGACAVEGAVEEEAFAWGADAVVFLENRLFSQPTAHLFADALTPVFKEKSPRLVLFPLTDFGRAYEKNCGLTVFEHFYDSVRVREDGFLQEVVFLRLQRSLLNVSAVDRVARAGNEPARAEPDSFSGGEAADLLVPFGRFTNGVKSRLEFARADIEVVDRSGVFVHAVYFTDFERVDVDLHFQALADDDLKDVTRFDVLNALADRIFELRLREIRTERNLGRARRVDVGTT